MVIHEANSYRTQHITYKLRPHFFQLGDEICEELGHVLLFACVEGLVVHGVDFTEAARVVSLPLTLLEHNRFIWMKLDH